MKTITLLAAIALAFACASPAAVIYNVTVNTAPLAGGGLYHLDFQFFDGSGAAGDLNNNTITLSNFNFGAGSATGSALVQTGGVTGDLGTGLVFKDTIFFNEFLQGFQAGNKLTFQIATTTNIDPGGTPDQFSFAILDRNLLELPTLGPASELFSISLNGNPPQLDVYRSAPGSNPLLEAPTVAAVPEPSFGLLLVPAAGALWALRRRSAGLR